MIASAATPRARGKTFRNFSLDMRFHMADTPGMSLERRRISIEIRADLWAWLMAERTRTRSSIQALLAPRIERIILRWMRSSVVVPDGSATGDLDAERFGPHVAHPQK